MKTCIVFAIFIVTVFTAVHGEEEIGESSHTMVKRDTIYVDPPFPRCVFYQCIGNCRQRGHRGGYCTINGCQCLN
uniref:Gallerimycin-like protein n=1 Tax=Antheraea pernyi TaxID=7119 RepID=B2CZ91_ANTPE|nr:gallerimycin-like protein [Antheraea pernyi]